MRVKLVSDITVDAATYALAMLEFHRERIVAAIAPIRVANPCRLQWAGGCYSHAT
jgi:hypothetical protein